MTEPPARVGQRLVAVNLVLAVENDAWAAGMYELADLVLNTGFDHVPRANGIGRVKFLPRAPDARMGF